MGRSIRSFGWLFIGFEWGWVWGLLVAPRDSGFGPPVTDITLFRQANFKYPIIDHHVNELLFDDSVVGVNNVVETQGTTAPRIVYGGRQQDVCEFIG